MGIFSFLKFNKANKVDKTNQDEKSVLAARKYGEQVNENNLKDKSVLAAQQYGKHADQSKNEDKFVEKLSLLELSEIDWSEFGAKLKQEKLLPPSYDRNPTSVKFRLSKTNKPIAEIVFNSKTSDSYRMVMIHDDNDVFEYTNGAQNSPTRKELIDVWLDFKKEQKRKIEINKILEANNIKYKANKLKNTAESMMNIENLFADELEFLEEHKDDVYDFFGYMFDEDKEIPFFVTSTEKNDLPSRLERMVVAFSPKTLEFCVSRLEDNEKYYIADDEENLEEFIKKCKNVASNSIYETDKWEKTINILVEMLKKHADEYRAKKGIEKE